MASIEQDQPTSPPTEIYEVHEKNWEFHYLRGNNSVYGIHQMQVTMYDVYTSEDVMFYLQQIY